MPANCPHRRKQVLQIDATAEETTYKCMDCGVKVTPLGPAALVLLEQRESARRRW